MNWRRKNNHGTWCDVQAVAISLFTDQPQPAKQILPEQTTQRINHQFETDGRQPLELERTLSWNYSYRMNTNVLSVTMTA